MIRTLASLLLFVCFTQPIKAGDPVPRTTLSLKNAKWTRAEKEYVILKRADIEMTIVTNAAVDDEHLKGHKEHYSGIAKLVHTQRANNLFVPSYAGLNYEHIHDGVKRDREILFEPRFQKMELRIINEHTVELYQPPAGHFKLESASRYELLEDGTIQLTYECIPRAKNFQNGYIGLFWASYINQPESLDIFFPGFENVEKILPPDYGPARMIRGITPRHGTLATHRGAGDKRTFPHDADFPLSLVFGHSNHRFAKPWYYGVSHGMGFAQIFRESDQIRLTQSPSGGGNGNPAWDFQYFIPNYKVGQRYQLVMRAVYMPLKNKPQFLRRVTNHFEALQSIK